MRFDFTDKEKEILNNICVKMDNITDRLNLLKKRGALLNLIDEFTKAGYFNLCGSMLNNARSKLAKKDFELYFVLEMGVRLLNRVISLLNISTNFDISKYKIVSFAYIEHNNNFNIKTIDTIGIDKGDYYIVSGEKRYVGFLNLVDYIMVLGKVDNVPCFFIVNKKDVEAELLKSPFALNNLFFYNIRLNNVRVLKENIIGPIKKKNFLDIFFHELNKISISAAIGLMQGCFNEAKEFAKSHKNNGRPIIHYQEVGFKLAEMKTILDASYLIGLKSASNPNIDKDALMTSLVAKIFCLESFERIVSDALSIFSIHGFFNQEPMSRLFELAKFLQTIGTSIEVSRVDLGDLCLGYKKV